MSGNRGNPNSGRPQAQKQESPFLSLPLTPPRRHPPPPPGLLRSLRDVCPSLPAAPALTVLAVSPTRPLHPTTRIHTQEKVGGGEEAAPAHVALQMWVPARGSRCPRQQQPGQAQPEAAAHPDLCPAARGVPAARSGAGLWLLPSNGRMGAEPRLHKLGLSAPVCP